jgi:hypothetical protein
MNSDPMCDKRHLKGLIMLYKAGAKEHSLKHGNHSGACLDRLNRVICDLERKLMELEKSQNA